MWAPKKRTHTWGTKLAFTAFEFRFDSAERLSAVKNLMADNKDLTRNAKSAVIWDGAVFTAEGSLIVSWRKPATIEAARMWANRNLGGVVALGGFRIGQHSSVEHTAPFRAGLQSPVASHPHHGW